MLTGIGSNTQKFNLLYLEEGESYIQDFFGKIEHFDLVSQTYRQQEVMLHFCSRSLIVEVQKDGVQPLYKYLLTNFKKEPSFDQSQELPMEI